MKYVTDIKKNCESLPSNIPIPQNPDFSKFSAEKASY